MSLEHSESPMKLERSSLKEQIIPIIKEWILNGEIQPGERLVEREIAERLGVSRIPVRDALQYLETVGLVVADGYTRRVVSFDRERLLDLYQIRIALEELAVQLTAERMNEENRAILKESFESFAEALEGDDAKRMSEMDMEFHRCIWRLSGNSQLYLMMNSIVGPINLFALSYARRFDWSALLGMHQNLYDAICRSDGEAAKRSMQYHMEVFRDRAVRLLSHDSVGIEKWLVEGLDEPHERIGGSESHE
ncbi:MAG: GntR family transcriptional regulator [Anaerolineaceae bacterium]|nr:GntR family transcriptional regulator [Anaerolineaceae bacterium]